MFKNQKNTSALALYSALTEAQLKLALCCLRNNLELASYITFEHNSPVLSYSVGTKEAAVFQGKCYAGEDQVMKSIMDMIKGAMVSQVSPPAATTFNGEKVAYWRREMVSRQDVTKLVHDDNPNVTTQVDWVGYNHTHVQVARVADGSSNPGWDGIKYLEYVSLGPLGTVVAVVPRNIESVDFKNADNPPTLGELIRHREILEEERIANEKVEAQRLANLNTDQLGALSTGEIGALTTSDVELNLTAIEAPPFNEKPAETNSLPENKPEFIKRLENKPEFIKLRKLGFDETTAERFYRVLDRDYGVHLQSHVPYTPKGMMGFFGKVVFAIPTVPDNREVYDAMSPEGRSILLGFVESYRQIVQDETVKKLDQGMHDEICAFLRNFLQTDVFHKLWWDEMQELTMAEIDAFPTRTVFGGGLMNFSDKVMVELFGDYDPSPTAKVVVLAKTTNFMQLSSDLGVSTEFITDFLAKHNYIVFVNQDIDREVATLVAHKLGFTVDHSEPAGGVLASIE